MEHMSKEYYIELGLRQAEEMISDEEQALLEKWIKEDPKNKAMLEDILNAYGSATSRIEPDSHAAFAEIREKITSPKIQQKTTQQIFRLRRSWLVAASVLLLVGTLGVFYILQSGNAAQKYLALDQSKSITLPDGSKVTLAPGASLDFQNQKEGRFCSLKGTALFDVSTTGQPFVVTTESLEVEVLGTIFEVRQDASIASVSVTEGRVQVSSGPKNMILTRGDRVDLAGGQLSEKKSITEAIGQWHRQSVTFDNLSLKAGLDSLSQFYPVTFELANNRLEHCRLQGTLGLGSVEAMIQTLETMLDATITQDVDGVFEIDGQGCAEQ